MTTRMIHPLHGATHAYGTQDIEKHKALGWLVESEVQPAPVAVADATKEWDGTPGVMGETVTVMPPVHTKRAYHRKAK